MAKAIFHHDTEFRSFILGQFDGETVEVFSYDEDLDYATADFDGENYEIFAHELEFIPRHALKTIDQVLDDGDKSQPDWVGAKVILTHVPEDRLGPAIDEYLVKGYDNDLYYGWCTDGGEGGLEWNELSQDVEVIIDADGRNAAVEKFKHLNFNQQKTIQDMGEEFNKLEELLEDAESKELKTWHKQQDLIDKYLEELDTAKDEIAHFQSMLAERTRQFDKAVEKINYLNKKLLDATKDECYGCWHAGYDVCCRGRRR